MNEPERLAAFDSACRRIWPYIRYFGLCGADSEALEAMAEIGRLIGRTPGGVEAIAAGAAESRQRQQEIDAAWFEQHIGRKMLRSDKAELMRKFDEYREEGQ